MGLITKGAENGIRLVKEVQDGIEFRNFSVVHNEDAIIVGLWSK